MNKTTIKTTTPQRIAAYIRVSTDEQAHSGLGMDAQRTRCKALCQMKGWHEPTFYIDDGISGTKPLSKRAGLQHLFDDVRQGKIDAVVIPSLDRLARKLILMLTLVDELCTTHNIALVSCKESFDTSTPQGTLMLHVFGMMAQFERDIISQRTKEAIAENDKRRGERGGRMPYGYIRLEQTILIDEAKAKIVRRIFALRKRGMSLRDIGLDVGKAHTSVAEILRNEKAYRGGKRGESDIRWPRIVS